MKFGFFLFCDISVEDQHIYFFVTLSFQFAWYSFSYLMPSLYIVKLGFDLEPSISKLLGYCFFCGIEPFPLKIVAKFVL